VFEEIFLLKMGNYPPNEIIDMIRIVGEAGNNYSAAALFGKIPRQTPS